MTKPLATLTKTPVRVVVKKVTNAAGGTRMQVTAAGTTRTVAYDFGANDPYFMALHDVFGGQNVYVTKTPKFIRVTTCEFFVIGGTR